jgi:Holliday junction resolvase RusA-like endonuclease
VAAVSGTLVGALRYVIAGAPRTKKNHGRRIKRGAHVFSVPSLAAVAWEASAITQMRRQGLTPTPVSQPVRVHALIYREANRRGDLVGYFQAIGDALQGGHGKSKVPCVLDDDEQIKSWDGSRLRLDRKNPRIEITIEPFDDKERP